MSTVLVTGANRGIGLALIRQLLARPESAYPTIIGTSRQIVDDELGRLQSEHPERVKRLQLRDVGTAEAVEELADQLKSVAPNGVNVLINNAGQTTQPRHKIFSPLGALEYQAQLQASSFGPLLLSSTLISHGLLSSVAGLKPDINRKPYALSHLADSAHSVSDNPLSRDLTINAKSDPTALAEVPIIANISSTQGSLAYAAELFNGGANRDDLIFHPIYASVKGALSAMTLHLARELRDECIVNAIHPGWVRTEHGRKYAPLSTDESASKILDLIESWKTTADSGQWVDEEGRKVPW